jgi:ParB/RepB/Spo0J family partition protein
MAPMAMEEAADAAFGERFLQIPIGELVESKLNPRKTFDGVKLAQLTASVREKGIVEPLVVRQVGFSEFEIVAGVRRYRAAASAGLSPLPCVVRTYSDAQALEIMAIENGQREGVPPLEEAAGYKKLLLIDKTYTPAMIARKIGHDERYVWDRLRLLELVDEAKQLLTAGTIGVQHAEVLSNLKPEEQRRAIHRDKGGLFERAGGLAFDDAAKASAYKPVSVRELKSWVAHYVRFDVEHAAKVAPLEFEPTAVRVEQTAAAERKVIPITYAYHLKPETQADERTYTIASWRKAENKNGQPTCDYAALGVVVAGEHYGESFHVCVARDKCRQHFAKEITQREKTQRLRERGQGKQAAKQEQRQADRETQKWQRDQEAFAQRRTAWQKATPAILEAVRDAVGEASLVSIGELVLEELVGFGTESAGARKKAAELLKVGKSAEDLLRFGAFLVLFQGARAYNACDEFPKTIKGWGVDVAAIVKAATTPEKARPGKKGAAA